MFGEAELKDGYDYGNSALEPAFEKDMEENRNLVAACYQKAAEQGDADAQYNLALCYEQGDGVETDEEKATEWYQKSAELGNAAAKKKVS